MLYRELGSDRQLSVSAIGFAKAVLEVKYELGGAYMSCPGANWKFRRIASSVATALTLTAFASPASTAVKITPTVTWPAPANITSGTELSGMQLDATASVPGMFVYTPPAGTVLSAGTQRLSVTFKPADGKGYTKETMSVPITVNVIGNLTVTNGQTYIFSHGVISGNVVIKGGSLVLNSSTVGGDVQMSGGGLSVAGSSAVGGSLHLRGNSTYYIDPSARIAGLVTVIAPTQDSAHGGGLTDLPIFSIGQ
jgi:hypothetical protein